MGQEVTSGNVQGLLMFKDGTVCDDGFNDRSATLICQEMGFEGAVSWLGGRYDGTC